MTTLTAAEAAGTDLVRRPRRRRLFWLLLLVVALLAVSVASITIGARNVPLPDLIAGLQGHTENVSQAAVVKRVPRTVLGLLVGAALGLSGAIMQAVTRNPLADPSILGVNMGASLAVVIGIVWFGLNTAHGYIWAAIIGAGAAAVFVYIVGSLGRGGATPLKLALAGAATSAALVSFVTAISLPRADLADIIRSWQIGGIGGATFANVAPMLPFLGIGLVIAMLCANPLNSLALGDELAAGLGERVMVVRAIAALAAVILCGATTAMAGPIGFVGLVVPHLCRLLIGVDQRWLLPFSALVGAALLLLSDIIGRVVARPGELDVGILTALIGAPVFIAIVRRSRIREL